MITGRICPGQIVDVSIPGGRIARFPDALALRYGLPGEIVLAHGPEGTGRAMFDWSERTGIRLRFIEPGKPVQDAFVEAFNGKLRDEGPNLHWVRSPRHAREEIERWRQHDNTERPHSALGYLSPRRFWPRPSRQRLRLLRSPCCRSTLEPDRRILDRPGTDHRERS